MKLLLIIDHFGLGGAQRQMVELACGMKRRGHDVHMFSYFPRHDFFRELLLEHRIALHEYAKGRGFSFGVLKELAKVLRAGRFDIVLSFLSSPNIYAELAVQFAKGPKLVVSERVGHEDDGSPVFDAFRRMLHVLSDQVVANSRTHAAWLKRKWWLREKVSDIYNGLNLQMFRPEEHVAEPAARLRLISIGRISAQKNILNLIAALALLRKQTGDSPEMTWVGDFEESENGRRYRREVDEALQALPDIRDRWHWLGVRTDVAALLARHDALIHPSFYEGLPNVICEALAVGLPVIASDVCDHSFLVAHGQRGFLFDPASPQGIAAAILAFARLGPDSRERMSEDARRYAEESLGIEKMVGSYERLFARLLDRAR